MIALTLPDTEIATAINAGIWQISQPLHAIEEAGNVTRYLCDQRDNVLIVDPDTVLPIHPDVSAQAADQTSDTSRDLGLLLGPLLTNPADLATVGGWIVTGGVLRIADVLPLIQPELLSEWTDPGGPEWT